MEEEEPEATEMDAEASISAVDVILGCKIHDWSPHKLDSNDLWKNLEWRRSGGPLAIRGVQEFFF